MTDFPDLDRADKLRPVGNGQSPPPTSTPPSRTVGTDVTESRPAGILVVGPRELPGQGAVEVWADAGSGGSGQRITVDVGELHLAGRDTGEGRCAIYELQRHCYED